MLPGDKQQNIEIKVRLTEADYLRVKENSDGFVCTSGGMSTDVDTYFRVPHGRLKLRVSGDQSAGTLISYARPNEATSRLSHYRLVPIPDAHSLRDMLSEALGVLVTVNKQRTVCFYGATRIHFDHVEELGWFIELETVMSTQNYETALAEHRYIFQQLGLDAYEIVPGSYSDLLLDADR